MHAGLGVLAAARGIGTTERASRGLRHGYHGSRAAAPKHGWVETAYWNWAPAGPGLIAHPPTRATSASLADRRTPVRRSRACSRPIPSSSSATVRARSGDAPRRSRHDSRRPEAIGRPAASHYSGAIVAASPPFVAPDVLVLGAGGTLGEAWMTGLLAGIEEARGLDLLRTESFVGTSAGAIVAARLAGGRRPRRPPGRAEIAAAAPAAAGPGRLERLTTRILGPACPPAMRLERIPGGLIRGRALALLPEGAHSTADLERSLGRLRARFDGRLRVVGVDLRSGGRVVFGAPGAPDATVARAVAASCAVPGYFRPVRIGGRDYVDGAAWSLNNLDVAPAGRRTELLCLSPTAGLPVDARSPLGLIRAALRSRQLLEVAALRRRGVRLRMVGPGRPAARLMAADLMDPTDREAVLRAGYAQGLGL